MKNEKTRREKKLCDKQQFITIVKTDALESNFQIGNVAHVWILL